ncbi:MAG: alpha/beta hydrolase [Planctomycetales bacterium]|nr:alpha/beta hydrolase [Planctomycetales bacterium]
MKLTPRSGADSGVLLYLHGGGYCFGTPSGYRPLVSRLARGARMQAFVLDYRLAPEHPFPAALDDALAAYRALVETNAPEQIAVAGDSAGGGLTVTLLHRLRDAGLPLPRAAALLSPWLDLTHSGATITTCAATELLVPEAVLVRLADWYAAGHELSEPSLSPLFGRHEGLPPLLVQASTTEALHSDAHRFANFARAAGVEVRFEEYDRMWHAWHLMAPLVKAARTAIRSAGEFLVDHYEPKRGSSSHS